MKALTTAALVTLAMITTATAGDLPSKKTPPAPPTPVAEPAYPASWYAGVNLGGDFAVNRSAADTPGTVGVVVGREINRDVRVEATVDNYFPKNGQGNNVRGAVNAVYGPFSMMGITPYVLAGVGLQSDNNISAARGIYNVGAGVRYGITKNWEADARYRWVNTWSSNDKESNVVTLGMNYKF